MSRFCLGVCLGQWIFVLLGTVLLGEGSAAVPPHFTDTALFSIGGPTGLAFTPDGRMLIATQGGTLRVYQNGQLLPTPALSFAPNRICANRDQGLLGLAVDPAFVTNNQVYLYYTAATPDCFNRVSRFTLPASNVINPASEVILLNNIPSPNAQHDGGDLNFGKDGYLYVSVGDGGCDYRADSGCGGSNDAARDRNTLLGKILRITKDGAIPPSNPFLGTNTARCQNGNIAPGVVCQETFAWGLRNPFRFAFDPNAMNTRFFINDVGQEAREEVNRGQAGADYGWNCREGTRMNSASGPCSPAPPNLVAPVFEYAHRAIAGPNGSRCRGGITGGAFVPNGLWPGYDGTYLFADVSCGAIMRLSAGVPYTAFDFATDLVGGVVALRFGPSGNSTALYYTVHFGFDNGEVRRIRYETAQPTLAINNTSVTEGNSGTTGATFTVTVSHAHTSPISVHYATGMGNATAGSDYTAASGTLTFAAGQTSKALSVVVRGDIAIEATETFVVSLSSATGGATIADPQGFGTILTDDRGLSISDAKISEGNSGGTSAVLTLSLSAPSMSQITLNYTTVNGSAVAGIDYLATQGRIAFLPGETKKSLVVTVLGDIAVEGNETFYVTLSLAGGATITDAQGAVTILNNDGPVFRVSDVRKGEGNRGVTELTFTVTVNPASTGVVSVGYATANGSAVAGSDYAAVTGNLTFTAGQASRTITVPVASDTSVEPNETFAVNLGRASGATVIDGQGVGTILNDDGPVLRVNDVRKEEGQNSSNVYVFTVTLWPASASTVTVSYFTTNNSAVRDSDFLATNGSLTFVAGQTSRAIVVIVNGDTEGEENEQFAVNLGVASGASVIDGQGIGTIINDDSRMTKENSQRVESADSTPWKARKLGICHSFQCLERFCILGYPRL